jgi:hypothetical protein
MKNRFLGGKTWLIYQGEDADYRYQFVTKKNLVTVRKTKHFFNDAPLVLCYHNSMSLQPIILLSSLISSRLQMSKNISITIKIKPDHVLKL